MSLALPKYAHQFSDPGYTQGTTWAEISKEGASVLLNSKIRIMRKLLIFKQNAFQGIKRGQFYTI